ncbi:triphosphoribosyl-dephospho-CoA synthase [Oharaeibacter diazotrophicus]|uniref:Triphosphoribosyl-dephospho-CoA synthase n=1 Tax=Oharaeibacter diazotrophicus TaxID=1920512 RepID=A0A4R6RJF8_9HYPH|nr:triphosphoribosyl-dephospho-CoA synthase [Oharaeibacter diazotrophicus]TDP86600.1 triphosphoribosyl-dephospho-CoA synthase [Oharaeibacter diazotrophicus]BBE71458.1 ATP:dephospho-CoA triphosphoribosyl transferase [Pleomorphomonas sp. SM30]GLS78218.1 triphosphoribosyl-dephospho-CoA synthase [Oharaeibacter diazotrophicus]
MSALGERIETAFRAACAAELRAIKPGNVHDHAPGHRMTVADFEVSADVSAPHLARPGAGVGARIEGAVTATIAAVGQNTNLGILLLCAPLALAFETLGGTTDEAALRARLAEVLAATSVDDAAAAFQAIVAANPGGLGSAPEGDVGGPAIVTLTEAMALAAERDRIARQYVTTFADVFETGLVTHRRAMVSHARPSWVTASVYFAFAAGFPDTHVERKHGAATAAAVRAEFAEHRAFCAAEDLPALLEFDRGLKRRGINPGTSADLTVATEFVGHLLWNK